MCKGVYAIKIPKGEIVWFTRYEKREPKYVITSKQLRDWYYIYEVNGDELKKARAGKNASRA